MECVPEPEGVYSLLDENKTVIAVAGHSSLSQTFQEKLEGASRACCLFFEDDPIYTRRESRLMQQFFRHYGRLPEGGGDDFHDFL